MHFPAVLLPYLFPLLSMGNPIYEEAPDAYFPAPPALDVARPDRRFARHPGPTASRAESRGGRRSLANCWRSLTLPTVRLDGRAFFYPPIHFQADGKG
ncbi:hypothetical protein [Hymenobacter sp.]|uniref:hypothetical protein n=1 Tax=Hymenobacter sp. TaxID=1898978 RepID=UPI00286BC359|nr:hypothetical protein [Hymenobacter sp.]